MLTCTAKSSKGTSTKMAKIGKVNRSELMSTGGVAFDVTMASAIVEATANDPGSAGALLWWALGTVASHFIRKWLFTEN